MTSGVTTVVLCDICQECAGMTLTPNLMVTVGLGWFKFRVNVVSAKRCG